MDWHFNKRASPFGDDARAVKASNNEVNTYESMAGFLY
tara:strand:- start:2164 stop:2277 length:114 start_codon:yes stop_codon:yes gene_type:complete